MDEIQRLEEELAQVRTALHAENQRGALKDSSKVAELEAKMEDLSQQIEVEKRLAKNEQDYEQRVEESQTEIYSILDNLRVGDKSIRELFLNITAEEAEAAYQVVSAIWKKETTAIVEKELLERQEIEKQLIIEKKENADLQAKNDKLYAEFTELRKQYSQVQFELEDTNAKLGSAALQLQEANTENKRLVSELDDLRKEIAVGAVNAPKVIDVTDAYEKYLEEKRKAEAARPAIYNKRWKDEYKKRHYIAYLAETGEEIEIPYLEIGKYREVTPEEAEVFRAEYEARQAQESVPVDTGAGVELTEQFQSEEDSAVSGLAEGDTSLEVAGQEATLEDRVKALELAVFGVANTKEVA